MGILLNSEKNYRGEKEKKWLIMEMANWDEEFLTENWKWN